MDFFLSKKSRRKKIKMQPFAPAWQAALEEYVPYYRLLPAQDQLELQDHIKVFLAEKKFVGALGLEVTDDMRVVIAAQACVLLLHRETDYFPKMDVVVIYPSTYVGTAHERTSYGVETVHSQARLGESSADTGDVVLAWDNVLAGANHIDDGHNVVFHEFAHQLDAENGPTDGAPILPTRSRYALWAKVLSHEYEDLITQVSHHHKTFIDPYGATDPAEFFAVVTETFFEKPRAMKMKHPELYAQLAGFYQQDPAALMASRLGGSDTL